MEFTPPDLRQAADTAKQNLLPDKSKKRYENCYAIFNEWCKLKKVRTVTENVILAYFSELAQQKKPSTLWATYSMLRTTLDINEKIDISKFTKLIAFLKKKNTGYKPKKSSVFTREDIDKFLNEAPIEYLLQKVINIILNMCSTTI